MYCQTGSRTGEVHSRSQKPDFVPCGDLDRVTGHWAGDWTDGVGLDFFEIPYLLNHVLMNGMGHTQPSFD